MSINPNPDRTETGPARKGSTERCANPDCGHTKRDHSGRRDHTTKHPNIPLRPWCHACESGCLYEPPTAAVSVVPPATNQTAEEHRLALSEALGLGTGAPWDAIHDRVTELGLPPLDQDPVARRLGLLAAYRATVLREAADRLADEIMRGARFSHEDARQPGLAEAIDLLRRLAAEAQPTTKPEPDGEPYAGDERPCLACNHSMDSHIRVDGEIVCVFEDCSDPTPAGVGQGGAQPQGPDLADWNSPEDAVYDKPAAKTPPCKNPHRCIGEEEHRG